MKKLKKKFKKNVTVTVLDSYGRDNNRCRLDRILVAKKRGKMKRWGRRGSVTVGETMFTQEVQTVSLHFRMLSP